MSGTRAELQTHWKIRQRLELTWNHEPACPGIGNGRGRPERCRCGMPPILALELAREAAIEELRKSFEEGDWAIPFHPRSEEKTG